MADSSARQVLTIAEGLIPSDEVLVQVRVPPDSVGRPPEDGPTEVRLTHVPTEALLRLRLELDAAAGD